MCESHQVLAVLPQGTAWSGQGSEGSLLDQSKEIFSSQVLTYCCLCPWHLHDAHADAEQLHRIKPPPVPKKPMLPYPRTRNTSTLADSYLPMESLPKAPAQQPWGSLLLLSALSGNAVPIPMGIGVPGHSSQLRHQDCLHTVFLRCLCVGPHPGHLVNLHDGFWRVVDVDIHQGRV